MPLWVDGDLLTPNNLNNQTLTTLTLDGNLQFDAATARIIPGVTNFAINNNASSANNLFIADAGLVGIRESANANMEIGLTINQEANASQAFCLKSSDVGTGLTTGFSALSNDIDSEVDDFYTITKMRAGTAGGGALIRAIAENANVEIPSLELQGYGFSASITDTTTSVGLINIFGTEHDGLNTLRNAATDDNLFTVQSWSGGARVTRLLLKGDDGELHLGNTTLVALDEYDDVQLVRAMQVEASRNRGIKENPWGVPAYDYDVLHKIGVLGPKDESGDCLFAVQPRFAMNEGAIWQAYVERQEMKKEWKVEHEALYARVDYLERKLLNA